MVDGRGRKAGTGRAEEVLPAPALTDAYRG